MKIYYFNDETESVTIRIVHREGRNEVFHLPRQTGDVFEVYAPEGAVLYVKRWENRVVMLSYVAGDSDLLTRHV